MKIRILPSATQDLDDAWFFYEKQERGMGGFFIREIILEIDSLEQTAGVHRKVHGYHRYVSKRFPYAVFYRLTETIDVFRVLDCRRDPRKIRKASCD